MNQNTIEWTGGPKVSKSARLSTINEKFLGSKPKRKATDAPAEKPELDKMYSEILKAEQAAFADRTSKMLRDIWAATYPVQFLDVKYDAPAAETYPEPKFAPAAALVDENPHPRRSCPSHTRPALDPRSMPDIARWASKIIKDHGVDGIAACGHSGLVVAGAVSFLTGVPVFAVRKDGEPVVAGGKYADRVSGVAPEGKARRWVWIDDFLSSGGTFRRSLQHLWKEGYIAVPWPVAILEYRYGRGMPMDLGGHSLQITPEAFPGFDFSHAPAEIPFYDWCSL